MPRQAAHYRQPSYRFPNVGLGSFYLSGGFSNGESWLSYWNRTMLPTDIPGILWPNESSFAGAAVATSKPQIALNGVLTTMENVTDDVITTIIAECKTAANGGLVNQGAYFAWGDETTTTVSQLRDGYTLNVAPFTIVSTGGINNSDDPATFNIQSRLSPTTGPFPSSGNFLITIESEQLLVTSGQATNTWTASRAQNGTSIATHTQGKTITLSNALNASITGSATTFTLQNTLFNPGFPFVVQIENEFINVLSGSATNTIKRAASGSSSAAHAQNVRVDYVWPDPGLTAVNTLARAAGLQLIFVPLNDVWSRVAQAPTLASLPDIVGYSVLNLQNNDNFPAPFGADAVQMRAAGVNKIAIEMNTFNKNFPTVAYTPAFVINQINQLIQAGNPDYILLQSSTSAPASKDTLQTVLSTFRPFTF